MRPPPCGMGECVVPGLGARGVSVGSGLAGPRRPGRPGWVNQWTSTGPDWSPRRVPETKSSCTVDSPPESEILYGISGEVVNGVQTSVITQTYPNPSSHHW